MQFLLLLLCGYVDGRVVWGYVVTGVWMWMDGNEYGLRGRGRL